MHSVHRFDRLSSTQDELHRLAAANAPAGTIVVAVEQGAGRGSRGRAWASPPGGLWLSFLCRPARAIGAEVLSIRVGLAAADALVEVGGLPPIRLKWPNDLMTGDRKVGGILCEARWQGEALAWVSVGIGLNVRNDPPVAARLPAASLGEWRPDLEPDHVLWPLVTRLESLAELGTPLSGGELAAFAGRDWLAGRELAAPIPGLADGITADGALRILRSDGTTTALRSGDVTPAVELAGSAITGH